MKEGMRGLSGTRYAEGWKGAWYAVEQCRNLLRDTEILYQAKAYASKCDRRECRGEQVVNSGKPETTIRPYYLAFGS
jgi:hypothetical protein